MGKRATKTAPVAVMPRASGDDDLATYHRLRALVDRTNKENPDAADVAALKRELEAHPFLWRFAGDLTRRAADKIVDDQLATPYVKESIRRGMEEMRRELGYGKATLLERALIDRVVMCSVNLDLLQMLVTEEHMRSHSVDGGLYWDRRLTTAHRRFERACESLAKVSRLVSVTRLQDERTAAVAEMLAANRPKPPESAAERTRPVAIRGLRKAEAGGDVRKVEDAA